MFELNCEAQMRFSLVVSEKTKQFNFYETLCTLILHRSACVSFSAKMQTGRNDALDMSCSPHPALSNEDHGARDRKRTEQICAVSSLSAMQSVPAR